MAKLAGPLVAYIIEVQLLVSYMFFLGRNKNCWTFGLNANCYVEVTKWREFGDVQLNYTSCESSTPDRMEGSYQSQLEFRYFNKHWRERRQCKHDKYWKTCVWFSRSKRWTTFVIRCSRSHHISKKKKSLRGPPIMRARRWTRLRKLSDGIKKQRSVILPVAMGNSIWLRDGRVSSFCQFPNENNNTAKQHESANKGLSAVRMVNSRTCSPRLSQQRRFS